MPLRVHSHLQWNYNQPAYFFHGWRGSRLLWKSSRPGTTTSALHNLVAAQTLRGLPGSTTTPAPTTSLAPLCDAIHPLDRPSHNYGMRQTLLQTPDETTLPASPGLPPHRHPPRFPHKPPRRPLHRPSPPRITLHVKAPPFPSPT